MEHVEKQDAIETSMSKVLIEYKIPRMEALQMTTRDYTKKLAESLGIKEDASFQPILMPPSDQQKILMQKAKEDNSYYILRAEVKRTEIERIKKEKDVVQVWTDALIEPGYDYWCPQIGAMPDPANTFENVLDRLGVLAIRGDGYNLSGEGIVVGVLDGGITATGRPLSPREPGQIPFSTTSGTIPRVVGGWPNTDPEQLLLSRFSPLPPEWGTTSYDINDHGNMMAYDILRVAPRARLLDLRIARSSSTPITARISDACSAYDWAIGAYRAYGIPQIITCSWSLFQKNWAPDYAQDLNHVFTRKVEEAMNAGIIVLFNAGNCGIHCPNERCGSDPENIGPGHSIWGANGHPRVITVGAVTLPGTYIGYSSQGPANMFDGLDYFPINKPDFSCYSAFSGGYHAGRVPAIPNSGTSTATALTAGVVALLKQDSIWRSRPANHDAIKLALMNSAIRSDISRDNNIGAGYINALNALHELRRLTA